MENSEKWLVVNFIEEGSVEIVPRKWYMASTSKCFWPNNDYTGKVAEAIRKSCSPGAWDLHKVKVLGEYDDFELAERKVNKAKTTDNLTSENEVPGKRRPRPRKRLYESSSGSSSVDESDQENYPKPPKKPVQKRGICQTRISNSHSTEIKIHNPEIHKQPANIEMCASPVPEVSEAASNTPKNSQLLPSHRKEYSNEFERRVLRELYLINAKLTEHTENFEILLKSRSTNTTLPSITEHDTLEAIKHFPIKNEEQLLIVESILQDKDQFNKTAKYLSMLGGTEPKAMTMNIMYRMVSNDVGLLFNWEGTKNKKAFKSLVISDLIIKAVRLNVLTIDATENQIVGAIKIWLVKAKERHLKHLMNLKDQAATVQENAQ